MNNLMLIQNDCPVNELTIGCSWENKEETDIDLLLFLMDSDSENNKIITDIVYYDKKRDKNNSCYHYGDDESGKNKQHKTDNEVVFIDLNKLSDNTDSIAIVLNNYSGYSLSNIESLKCRVYSGKPGEIDEILIDFNIKYNRNIKHNTVILGYLNKNKEFWELKNENEECHMENIEDMKKHFHLFANNYKNNNLISKFKSLFNNF